MSWIGKQVKRIADNQLGVIVEEYCGHLDRLVIQMDDNTRDQVFLYPWATPEPNRFMFLSLDQKVWINLAGHEHGWTTAEGKVTRR